MPESLKLIWNDSVWSKVIAAIIVAAGTLLINYLTSLYNKKKFKDVFIAFWTYKFSLWFILGLIVLNILIIKFTTFSSYWQITIITIIIVIAHVLYNSKRKNLPFNQTPNPAVKENYFLSELPINSKLIFDINRASKFQFNVSYAQYYEGGKPIGEMPIGKFEFSNGRINVDRTNNSGRFIIQILKYLSGSTSSTFKDLIEKDLNTSATRIINIKFEAKIINGNHNIWFVSLRPGSNQWIHNAHQKFEITSPIYTTFENHFIINANEDFIIQIEDREVQNKNSNIQIQNLLIEEVMQQ